MKQLSSLHKISVSVLFIISSLAADGVDIYRQSAGAGEAGMGYVCLLKDSFWSSFHNQALLAYNKTFSLGFNYENRFSIKELGTRTAGLKIPAGNSSLGVVYSHFGYPDFVRQMTGLGCGLKITDEISAGVQVDYYSEQSPGDYSNNNSITFESGLYISPYENINIGIHLFNPVPNSLRKRHMPTSLRIGAGAELNKLLFTGLEAEMTTGRDLIIRAGFEYEAAKNLWLRGGFGTSNNSFSFGLGYFAKIVQLDFSFITHDRLGVTSSVSLIFKIH